MNKFKIVLVTLVVVSLTACASSPPQPKQPQGERSPVNPAQVLVSDLRS